MRTFTKLYYVLEYVDGKIEQEAQEFLGEMTRNHAINNARENLMEIKNKLSKITWKQIQVIKKQEIDYTRYGWWLNKT